MLRTAFLGILLAAAWYAAHSAAAQVMSSTNYQIQFDSINAGGGRAASAAYTSEDTVGEIATGPSDSGSYRLRAGYQQMNEVYLAMTAPANVTLSPALPGVTGGTANGNTAVTVTTDSAAGYQLTIRASSSPALVRNGGSDAFDDYTPAGGVPDYTFSVGAGKARFGFTPEGSDIAARFRNNSSQTCGAGTLDDADACWDGLSTGDVVVAERGSGNHPNGTQTTLKFRAGVGANANKLSGTYTATTTLTAVAL